MTPKYAIYALWYTRLVSWIVAMLWTNRTEKRDAIGAELVFRVLFYISIALLFAFSPASYSAQRQLWSFGAAMNWIFVALTAVALLFTW